MFKDLALEMKSRRAHIPAIEKITWYYRHWKDEMPNALGGLKNKAILPPSNIRDCEWNEWMSADPRNPQSQKVKDEKEAERQRNKELKKIKKLEQQEQNAEVM